ncbi:hypothetical protein F5Y19DRAFT_54001 [Xylariaceae sp. FL1651]|nr:hypothetical protein F5Y19DRAFT_54001 [Xylariaceae sp. FL1651]
MSSSETSSTFCSSDSSESATSSYGDDGGFLGGAQNTSPFTFDHGGYPQLCRGVEVRPAPRSPLAALILDSSEPRDVNSEARFIDWDGESFLYEPDGTSVGPLWGDSKSIAPDDSISVRDNYRSNYAALSDNEQSGSEIINLEGFRKRKYEDRLTKLGYVERLPDIDGIRHYRIELLADKAFEEDRVRTSLRSISLAKSNLVIINHDGLYPSIAADLQSFRNNFLEIKKSPLSGYGGFAICDLEAYTPILVERELFNANTFNLYNKLEALTKEQAKAYRRLHGHKRTPAEDIRTAIWRTNSFSINSGGSVFLVASRFNHACNKRSNVEYSYDYDKKCMVFVTKQYIRAGDELFIRYSSDPRHLVAVWGFRCTCGGCQEISDEEYKAINPSWAQMGW